MAEVEKMDFRSSLEAIRQRLNMNATGPKSAGELDRQLQQEQLDKQRREWLKTLERAGIERRYQSCTFDKIAARGVPPQVTGEYQRDDSPMDAPKRKNNCGQRQGAADKRIALFHNRHL